MMVLTNTSDNGDELMSNEKIKSMLDNIGKQEDSFRSLR